MLLQPACHETFAEAYVAGVADVLHNGRVVPPTKNPSSIGSRFGAGRSGFRELSAYRFCVRRPDMCLLEMPARAMNLEYAVAQWIWVMGGSDDVAAISYYNPRGWNFTEDQQSLRGAFGYRLRRTEGIDQLERIVERLRRDPTSRREVAVVPLASDLKRDIRDQPCLVSLQFLLRDDELELVATMRSQSAALVLPYDASLFMILQCWMAARLGVKPGTYIHVAGSFHIYEEELCLAERLINSPCRAVSVGSMEGDPRVETEELISFESRLRTATLAGDEAGVARLAQLTPMDQDGFFAGARRLLAAGAADRLGMTGLSEVQLANLSVDWVAVREARRNDCAKAKT